MYWCIFNHCIHITLTTTMYYDVHSLTQTISFSLLPPSQLSPFLLFFNFPFIYSLFLLQFMHFPPYLFKSVLFFLDPTLSLRQTSLKSNSDVGMSFLVGEHLSPASHLCHLRASPTVTADDRAVKHR